MTQTPTKRLAPDLTVEDGTAISLQVTKRDGRVVEFEPARIQLRVRAGFLRVLQAFERRTDLIAQFVEPVFRASALFFHCAHFRGPCVILASPSHILASFQLGQALLSRPVCGFRVGASARKVEASMLTSRYIIYCPPC